MSKPRTSALKRIRFAPVALVAGIFAALLLSLSLTGTLSGFAASITNSSNTAATAPWSCRSRTPAPPSPA